MVCNSAWRNSGCAGRAADSRYSRPDTPVRDCTSVLFPAARSTFVYSRSQEKGIRITRPEVSAYRLFSTIGCTIITLILKLILPCRSAEDKAGIDRCQPTAPFRCDLRFPASRKWFERRGIPDMLLSEWDHWRLHSVQQERQHLEIVSIENLYWSHCYSSA